MRLPKIRSQILALGIVTTLFFSTVLFTVPLVSAATYVVHTPISINGNAQFTSANGVTGGSGTPNDPYIIEGWQIIGGADEGIRISNTTAYFVIRNCETAGFNTDGICLYNVTNGAIRSCYSNGDYSGFWIQGSSHCSIDNNYIVYYNWMGIAIETSTYNTFTNNICENGYDGIVVTSANNTFTFNILGNNSDVNAWDTSANSWNFNQKGNYWLDWQTPDADNNGIVDNARPIGGGSNYDYYPLVIGWFVGGYSGFVPTVQPYQPLPLPGFPMNPVASGLVSLFCSFTGENVNNGAPMACMMVGSFFFFIPLFIIGAGVASKSGKYNGLVILTFGLIGLLVCVVTGLYPAWFLIFVIAAIAIILAKGWF